MCTIEGLSNNPAEAYQQGRRDGQAETLQAVELSATDSQQLKECNSLLDEALSVIKLYAPNHGIRNKIEQWQATASV